MNYINIATIRECTTAEGPGRRFVIWVQGCLKKCKGCCNPEMQELVKNKIVSTDGLIEKIEQARNKFNINGITLLGGEPILQAKGLLEICKWCKENGLSVVLFTGYEYEKLLNSVDCNVRELLKYIDVLVDGEYVEDLYDTERSWVGSKNQKIYFLTDVYEENEDFFSDRKIEFLIDEKSILMNGWPFYM